MRNVLLSQALTSILGPGELGSIAFVRCVPPDHIRELCADPQFTIEGWKIFGIVARDQADAAKRLMPADEAVEYRESKTAAALLLVDVEGAGAGMDGIYSAAREVSEKELFREGIKIAKKRLHKIRRFAEEAVRQASRIGRHNTISPWREFAFLCECARDPALVGTAVAQIGLWPIRMQTDPNVRDCDTAARLVEKCLLASGSSSLAKIDGLMLRDATDEQRRSLTDFFRESAALRWTDAVARLVHLPELWVNNLNPGFLDQQIERIELASWRHKGAEKPYAWSGLRKTEEGLQAIINKDPQSPKERSKIEVRWNAFPELLTKGAAEYSVRLVYGSGEDEFIEQKLAHTGPGVQRAVFTEADFEDFDGTEKFESVIEVDVIGKSIKSGPTEEFTLQFGLTHVVTGSAGLNERSLVEGILAAEDDSSFLETINDRASFTEDRNHHVIAHIKGSSKEGKTVRVYRPPLLREIESQWGVQKHAIGRWRVSVRADGSPVGPPEFQEIAQGACPDDLWNSLRKASEKLCEMALTGGGFVSLVYADSRTAEKYITTWQEAIESGDPAMALAQTVEIRTLSNATIGLIVLPSHPIRVAWHAGYDALARYGRYTEKLTRKRLVKALAPLDGAQSPACLPGLERHQSFVFGDMLGFHAVAMVSDSDGEPKAAISQMAKALGAEDTAAASSPGTSRILSKEITRYLELHEGYETIHVNALRSGDAVTVARALGIRFDPTSSKDDEAALPLSFVLQLYPSPEQKAVAGRFITETGERRRSGAGFIPREDRWMFESHPSINGAPVPKLRWAKRTSDLPEPTSAAHISVAFDSFIANVKALTSSQIQSTRPWEVFGLAAPMQRFFSFEPEPHWLTFYPPELRGEKHPAGPALSDRLHRIHRAIQGAVVRNLDAAATNNWPVLRTVLKPEQHEMFERLHGVSDWVITIDRNAGIEYFDSPRAAQQVYDAYVIDCVPEREDLGAFQLITSTANFEEVMTLLEGALTEMGLSTSRRNCEFLLRQLKGISGRMAMRLAGPSTAAGELIALSLLFSSSRIASLSSDWPMLQNGFFIPLDDVPELLPLKQDPEGSNSRGDLLFVSISKRAGFQFQAIEVKYRRYLRSARDQELCDRICGQTEATIKRFSDQYFPINTQSCAELAPRRARLARIFRFYAEKARRHYLADTEYVRINEEIDKMLELGAKYLPSPSASDPVHQGFIFCPDFSAAEPESIHAGRDTEVFLFGPAQMPDIQVRQGGICGPKAELTSRPPLAAQTKGNDLTSSANARDEKPEAAAEGSAVVNVLLGASKNTDEPVYWQLGIRTNPHLMVVGLPGMGKTNSLVNICTQLVQNGVAPVVFSYHADIDDRLGQQVGPLNFIDYNGLGFNPMHVARAQPMAYIDNAGMIRDIFSSIFPDLGELQLGYLRDAVKEVYKQSGWDNAKVIAETPPFQLVFDELDSACPDKRLLLRLRELNDYGFFSAAGSDANVLELSNTSIIRIHSTQNESLQKAFSSFVLQNIYQSMFARGEQARLTHAIVIDEAHRASRLKLIPTLAKECRKYGILLIIASQEARDFQPSIFSAVGNYLVLRVTDQDAKLLANQSANSASKSKIVDRLKQMPKYHALFFDVERGRPEYITLRS